MRGTEARKLKTAQDKANEATAQSCAMLVMKKQLDNQRQLLQLSDDDAGLAFTGVSPSLNEAVAADHSEKINGPTRDPSSAKVDANILSANQRVLNS